ncbi:MAG: hypothetical protein HY644_06730 [Acidobacteria bacterium]|nr:hypothetical protein [Acidobacteriota bacterium]
MKSKASFARPIEAYLDSVRRALQRRRGGRAALASITALSVLFLLGTWYLYRADFNPGVLLFLRIFFSLLVLASLLAWLALWNKRIELVRVARYLEENNPHLQQRLVTAVDHRQEAANPFWPLLEKDALQSARSIRLRPTLQAQRPWVLAALAAIALTCATLLMGPPFFRYGLQKLLAFSQARGPLYEISVLPGNARIAPGMDQEIQARPVGFDPTQVSLFLKFDNQPHWERVQMERSLAGSERSRAGTAFGYLLMDIREPLRYYMEAEKIRSKEFRIEVADWPRVEKISLDYFYPPYTGLQPHRVDNEGNIRAIRGTRVRVQVQFNEAPQKPQLFFEGKNEAATLLTQDGKSYIAELTVQEDDQYSVRLASAQGEVRSSPTYEIVALDDQPPLIRFSRPGKDQKVSKLEEVSAELGAEDDFGLHSVQLNFSINGGKEKSIALFGPGNAREVTKDYTFYLEEMNVQPGDFIAYYGVARDAVSTSKTDIYFLEVKPFDREFYQSQQTGQAGGQQEDLLLSRRQKEIVAGTWKILQEDRKRSREQKSEDFRTLALIQQRLQQQVESIVDRLMRRQSALSDPTARQMVDSLREAAQVMEPAHQDLSREQAPGALTHEQQALQKLLRAEALMRQVQVSWGANAAGGGGGDSAAEELADLFELERDQMKNQYETLQQSQPGQQPDPKLDEALQKLKDLARRQQQAMQQESSAAQQRRLQQETEELARQLERLSRQRQNPQMEEIARQLQDASRNMQNSMQGQGGTSGSNRALDQLRRAQTQLSQMQQEQRRQEFSQLNQSAENLVRHQQEIEDRVSAMQQQWQQRGGVNGRDIMRLLAEKEELRRELRDLEQELDETARQNAAGQPKASKQLKSSANEIRDRRLDDKIQQGSSFIHRGLIEQARQREQSLGQEFRDLQNQIAQAQEEANGPRPAGDNSNTARMQRALQDAGRLLDQLEQMQRANRSDQQGKQGGDQRAQGDSSLSGAQQPQRDSGSSAERGTQSSSTSGAQQPGSSQRENTQGQQPSASRDGAVNVPGPTPGKPNIGIPAREGWLRDTQAWSEFWNDRSRDATGIRRALEGDREMTRQMDELIERMRQLGRQRAADPRGLEDLQSNIIQGFRALELKMSLRLQEKRENLQLFNQEDVPLEYRKAVEEYYKSLARSKFKDK